MVGLYSLGIYIYYCLFDNLLIGEIVKIYILWILLGYEKLYVVELYVKIFFLDWVDKKIWFLF